MHQSWFFWYEKLVQCVYLATFQYWMIAIILASHPSSSVFWFNTNSFSYAMTWVSSNSLGLSGQTPNFLCVLNIYPKHPFSFQATILKVKLSIAPPHQEGVHREDDEHSVCVGADALGRPRPEVLCVFYFKEPDLGDMKELQWNGFI